MLKRWRLWKSRWIGPRLNEWQTDDPRFRSIAVGPPQPCAWRLLSTGEYEYRALTQSEVENYVSAEAW